MKTWIGLVAVAVAAGMAAWFLLGGRSPVDPANDDTPLAKGPAWFEDATAQLGIDFVHDANLQGKFLMPEVIGSGVAVIDVNGDGKPDLYFLNAGGIGSKSKNRLFVQKPDGTFQDASAGSGLDIDGVSMGVAAGDVNNDGWPDLVVTQYGGRPGTDRPGIRLFINQKNGAFKEHRTGLENALWGASVNLVDFDGDGWLDVVVANYVDFDPSWPCFSARGLNDYCAPRVFKGTVSKLFRNLGAKAGECPRFEDVTVRAGLHVKPGPGLGVFCADFNGDELVDILIANDGQPNHLWIQQKDGTFLEEGVLRGIALDGMGQAQAGMGIAVGDLDDDGLLDVFVTHLTEEKNTLWMQGPKPGMFQDRTARSGLAASRWRATGFGTLMRDFDNDGRLDLAVANGRVARGTATPNAALGAHLSQYAERNQLFRNLGDRFEDRSESEPAFSGTPNVARGLAVADLDGDGGLDLIVTHVNQPARVYRNVAKNRGHWLSVRAFDPKLNRDALGARVYMRLGARSLLRVLNPGDSFLCSSEPALHFGLGDADRYDQLEVVWPGGERERFPGGPVDRAIRLERGKGERVAP